jgi:hypothetical protein
VAEVEDIHEVDDESQDIATLVSCQLMLQQLTMHLSDTITQSQEDTS